MPNWITSNCILRNDPGQTDFLKEIYWRFLPLRFVRLCSEYFNFKINRVCYKSKWFIAQFPARIVKFMVFSLTPNQRRRF